MKFNWGTGIVLALVVMIGGMMVLVSIAIRQDFDLVEDHYYQKSNEFQQHIDKVQRSEALSEKITFDQTRDSLILTFPKLTDFKSYGGQIQFYSPVEKIRDQQVDVKIDEEFRQKIDLKSLEKGRYMVKIEWLSGNDSYYQENEIAID